MVQTGSRLLNYSTSVTWKVNNQTKHEGIERNLTHSLSGDNSSSGAHCIQIRSMFTPGEGILEHASSHHTDYTELNTALC